MKQNKKYNNKSRKKRMNTKKHRFSQDSKVIAFFVLALVFYILSKTVICSQNMTLSMRDQELSKKLSQTQQQVDQLTSQVNNLEEKSRVLGLLNDKVAENQKNVYIID